MKTLLVFDDVLPLARESMTRLATPFALNGDCDVLSLTEAAAEMIANASFLVVGASNSALDGPPEGERVRRWFATFPDLTATPAAGLAVRPRGSPPLRCAEGVHRQLNLHRLRVIAPPGDFVADVDGALTGRDLERGLQWATAVARWFGKVSARGPSLCLNA